MDSAEIEEIADIEAPEVEGRRKGRLHLEVANRLRERIVSGELPPGSRLREVQLGTEMGVSRTPLREAFRTLAAEGMIDLLPNRSVVVSDLRGPELEHLIVVFANLESLAAELACKNVTEAQLAEMGRLLSQMVEYHEKRERIPYLEINQRIHRMTMEIAANPVLMSVWQSLVPRVERARMIPNLDPNRWTQALFEHTRMFAALASRDAPLLARITKEHFIHGLPYLAARAVRPPTAD